METVERGVPIPAKAGRTGFRMDFPYDDVWKGKHYETKRVEAYSAQRGNDWIVVTVLVKFF